MAVRKKKTKSLKAVPRSTNRVRELREERGLTAEQLASLVNTTEATISRLETGERKLTEDWMRRIARALDVEPADLLELAAFVNMDDEVEPYIGLAGGNILSAINAKSLLVLIVSGNQLEDAGIPVGYEAVFDTSEGATKNPRTGDIVLLNVTRNADGAKARFIRQFIAPQTFVTNQKGRNLAMDLYERNFTIEIAGVVQRPEGAAR